MLVFAHRGASGHAPDNTLKSFNLAIKMGTFAIESDIKRALQGDLVFFHDWAVKIPILRTRWQISLPVYLVPRITLCSLDLGEGQRIPAVDEIFRHYKEKGILGDITWSLDIPDYLAIKRLAKICKRYDNTENIHACNTKPRILAKWRDVIPEAKRVWSIRGHQLRKHGAAGAARVASLYGFDVLNVRCDDMTKELEEQVREHGLALYIWDVHDERRFQKAMSYKPDAIYTNYPDRFP